MSQTLKVTYVDEYDIRKMVGPSQGGRATMMRPLWGCRWLTAQDLCDFMGTTWAPCSNLETAVLGSCEFRTSLQSLCVLFSLPCLSKIVCVCPISAWPPRGARLESGYGLCNATYGMSTSYGLAIFKSCTTFCKTKKPVNLYENHTAASCLCSEAARKGEYGQNMGPVNPSQAKMGLKCTSLLCS